MGPDEAVAAFRAESKGASDEALHLVRALGSSAPALVPLVLKDPSIPVQLLGMDLFAKVEREALIDSLMPADMTDDAAVRQTLRRGRHLHLVRLALREALLYADVDTTAREMSALASAATEIALRFSTLAVTAARGVPRAAGRPTGRVCLGMGKLGGGELNLGSDVDVCFFYETDETDEVPGQKLSTHEIEAQIATRTSKILADVDELGFVFRVDLRLRPEGARGPVVNSLASAERYYESFGRAWERAVLLRARPIAGDAALGESLLELVRPFVFPRRVDPKIAGHMAQMLERSRQELSVDDVRDVKLGRGGIREAEFFVQTLQLVWGGTHPELRVAGTLPALRRLVRLGLVTEREARALEDAWALLRRIEHRVHVWTSYQSHSIPEGAQLVPFARSLGFDSEDALFVALEAARTTVARLFRSLLDETARGESRAARLCERLALGEPDDAELTHVFGDIDPDEARVHLGRLARHADDPLGPRARERHPDHGPRLLEEIADSADPGRALRFTADFFARLRGWDYLNLFEQRGELRRFVSLFGTSEALGSALVRHPEDIDLVLTGGSPEHAEIEAAHRALDERGLDAEALVPTARALKRQLMLRIGLSWTSGELALGPTLGLLSTLAVEQVGLAARCAERELMLRFGAPATSPTGEPASLVVVALGKLGAAEIGWGSDLDLVFVYDHEGLSQGPKPLEHNELFTRIAQRTLRLLSQPDVEGPGYETDTRLRPSGAQGTLVSSLPAFARYHEHAAEGWERLAWVRARPIFGSRGACAAVRAATLGAAFHGPPPSGQEVARMRARVEHELAAESEDAVHPKLGRGGLLDVEFLTQFLLLSLGHEQPDPTLLALSTSAAIDRLSAAGRLADGDARALSEDAAFLRTLEQSMRLLDEGADGRLFLRSRVADRVARRVGLRDRGGETAAQILAREIHRHRARIRGIFERVVAHLPAISSEPGRFS